MDSTASSRAASRSIQPRSAAAQIMARLTDDALIGGGRNLLARAIEGWQAAGRLPRYDAVVVAEILIRLVLSLVSSPAGVLPAHDPAAAHAFARRYVSVLLFPAD